MLERVSELLPTLKSLTRLLSSTDLCLAVSLASSFHKRPGESCEAIASRDAVITGNFRVSVAPVNHESSPASADDY